MSPADEFNVDSAELFIAKCYFNNSSIQGKIHAENEAYD
jgi:hypothetical protein